jgi:outer membrane protein assembly factor BamD
MVLKNRLPRLSSAFERFNVFIFGLSLLSCLCLLGLSGCATQDKDFTFGLNEAQMQALGEKEMNAENYKEALDVFEKLEARYPLGVAAMQAQINSAYCYFKRGELVLAISALDRFQKLYPKHPRTDYILYLRGLVHLAENDDVFSSISQQDPAERDSIGQQKAFDVFKQLVQSYPKSPYAQEAAKKLPVILTDLVKNEIYVARYYAKRGAWVAAVNRAKFVLETYPMIREQEASLEILVDGYGQLGLNDLQQQTREILRKNFPNNVKANIGANS